MRHVAVAALLALAGLAGLAWQLEAPPDAGAAARPVLVCPLGTHGLDAAPAAPPFPRTPTGY